jgi:hypothetical protein
MIIATMDDNQVMMNLSRLEEAIDKGVPKQVLDIAFETLRLSQAEVPHDEGTLQNSGTVEEVRGEVVVGYHTKYAARLHEHPEYRFQKGRKGKYLEDPIIRNEQALGIKFARGMGDEIGKAIR